MPAAVPRQVNEATPPQLSHAHVVLGGVNLAVRGFSVFSEHKLEPESMRSCMLSQSVTDGQRFDPTL